MAQPLKDARWSNGGMQSMANVPKFRMAQRFEKLHVSNWSNLGPFPLEFIDGSNMAKEEADSEKEANIRKGPMPWRGFDVQIGLMG